MSDSETVGQDTAETTPIPDKTSKSRRARKVATGTDARRGKITHSQLNRLIRARAAGLPVTTICRDIGITPGAATRALANFQKLFAEIKDVPDYRTVRSTILDAVELRTLKSLYDDDKHAGANLGQVAVAFREITNARRLEQGLHTSATATISWQFTAPPLDMGDFPTIAPLENENHNSDLVSPLPATDTPQQLPPPEPDIVMTIPPAPVSVPVELHISADVGTQGGGVPPVPSLAADPAKN